MSVKAPIWKDTYYTTTSNTLSYTIEAEGVTIFSGKAYKMPNAANIKININKICQDYLYQDIDTLLTNSGSTQQTNPNASIIFQLKDSDGTTLENYLFLYCWDYDYNWSGNSASIRLSEPINGHYANGQMKLRSNISGNGTVTTHRADSTIYTKEVCADYVLHFVTAKGGWLSFPFEGRCSKSDDISSYYFNRAYDNTTKEFEQGKYISEIVTTYKLNTGILTEEEAARFAKNVISTPKAYLQIISEGKIFPVVVTDNKADYKQYGEEDVITYELTVRESQSKIKQ